MADDLTPEALAATGLAMKLRRVSMGSPLYGLCNETATLIEAQARRIAELEAALKPFAKLVRSTFYSKTENEGYEIVLSNRDRQFTGQDIERARAALAKE